MEEFYEIEKKGEMKIMMVEKRIKREIEFEDKVIIMESGRIEW